eukprot:292334_1
MPYREYTPTKKNCEIIVTYNILDDKSIISLFFVYNVGNAVLAQIKMINIMIDNMTDTIFPAAILFFALSIISDPTYLPICIDNAYENAMELNLMNDTMDITTTDD